MQKVAAYLLERRDGMEWTDARRGEAAKILSAVEDWLREKGALDVAGGSGTYVAVDHSRATFEVLRAQDGDRSWAMYRLTEVTPDGRRFDASVSVTAGLNAVIVYGTLEVGSLANQISQVEVDPRCPRIVRTLIQSPGSWYHGESTLRGLSHVTGFPAGEALALEIGYERRAVPYVVISMLDGAPALDGLDGTLAHDLAGIANVFTIDDDAGWALTDTLRKPLSCYSGAVRVYWPGCDVNDDPFRHPLWTAARLRSLDDDERSARDRFRRRLRQLIMRASAISVVRPREIDEIRNAAARAEFANLKAEAKSFADFGVLADSYAADNDRLRREVLDREEEIAKLQTEVGRLQSERETLLYHLRQAKPDAADGANDNVEPDLGEDEAAPQGPPVAGEVRFYKKKFAAPAHDVMVPVGDCGHNNWQGAAKADKAKKGIAKLEGRDDWRQLQHCGKCTGGGHWRVEW
jgi:hypothetical protein